MKFIISLILCLSTSISSFAADPTERSVRYSGGSFPEYTRGTYLKVFLDSDQIRVVRGKNTIVIPANSVTEVSSGEAAKRRTQDALMFGLLSPAAGAILSFTKKKEHYVGIVWNENGEVRGIVLQAKKDDYPDLLSNVERLTGKTAATAVDPVQATRDLSKTKAQEKQK